MIKSLLSVVFIISMTNILLFAQDDYYATKDRMAAGVRLVNGSDKDNSKFCKLKEKSKIITLTPYDIIEYGFKDGTAYFSKDIQLEDSVRKVFLERLCTGGISLYYYKDNRIKLFFLEKDSSSLIEIAKRNKEGLKYNFQLMRAFTDCSNLLDATRLVSYNKKSLTNLITRYNTCDTRPFPHFKYGFYAGYELLKLVPPSGDEMTSQFNFKYEGGPMLGILIDNPILVSDFSIHSELMFSEHTFSYNNKVADGDFDFIAKITTIKIPLLVRYTFPLNKFRPFFNVGGLAAFNIKNVNSVYESIINQYDIEINKISTHSMIPDRQFGFSAGGGVERTINYKNSICLSVSFSKLYGFSNPEYMKNSVISIVTGYNF